MSATTLTTRHHIRVHLNSRFAGGKLARMSYRAQGPFDVQATPFPPYDTSDGVTLGRMTFVKQFRGDLEGTSSVEMLAARTPIPNSAGYVALERIVGSLHGKRGSFVVQHTATMTRGQPSLVISVIPDSGTGELSGLSGTMKIDNSDGKHDYDFEYSLG